MRNTAIFASILLSLWFMGCGQEADQIEQVEDSTEPAPTMATAPDFSRFGEYEADAREIWANVENTIERLKYGDKTGLYENEFSYFRGEKTMDDYLIHGEVQWANADSLSHVEIIDILFYERDSAAVDANFHMITSTGEVVPAYIRWVAYFHEGRWIKPYMSRIELQLEFEKLLRQADEAASEDW